MASVLSMDHASNSSLGGSGSHDKIEEITKFLVYRYLKQTSMDKIARKFSSKVFPSTESLNEAEKSEEKHGYSIADVYKHFQSKRKVEDGLQMNGKRHKGDADVTKEDEEDVIAAPKNNRPCYRCNKIGHFAKDCTSEIPSDTTSNLKKSCYKCNEMGHLAKDCTSETLCYTCRKVGHTSKECKEGGRSKVKSGVKCYHCGKVGHLGRECTLDGGLSCYKCGEKGHFSRECGFNEMLCFNCKKPGHLSRDCPDPNGATSKMTCYVCSKVGHISRDCTNMISDYVSGANSEPLGTRSTPQQQKNYTGEE